MWGAGDVGMGRCREEAEIDEDIGMETVLRRPTVVIAIEENKMAVGYWGRWIAFQNTS